MELRFSLYSFFVTILSRLLNFHLQDKVFVGGCCPHFLNLGFIKLPQGLTLTHSTHAKGMLIKLVKRQSETAELPFDERRMDFDRLCRWSIMCQDYSGENRTILTILCMFLALFFMYDMISQGILNKI